MQPKNKIVNRESDQEPISKKIKKEERKRFLIRLLCNTEGLKAAFKRSYEQDEINNLSAELAGIGLSDSTVQQSDSKDASAEGNLRRLNQ